MAPNVDGFIVQYQHTFEASNDWGSVSVARQDKGIVSINVFHLSDFQKSDIAFQPIG